MANQDIDRTKTGGKAGRNIFRIIVSLVLIAAGIGGARFLIATKPKASKRPPARMVPLVQAVNLQQENYTLEIPVMGTVMPAREISLEAQVSGEVVYLHPEFTEGGLLRKGEKILQIDRKDYELAVEQKKRALAEAEYSFKLEQGHQEVARREWELLYGEKQADSAAGELALRKPHLEKVKVEIAAATAELEQARINLDRTTLHAPFNVLVLDSHVELGSKVAAQERLADLVGTDAYWIKVSLPVEKLRWIRVPNVQEEAGSRAEIIYREEHSVWGRVIRLLPDLSNEGRMAQLLIEVKDPHGLYAGPDKQPLMLIGEYVRAIIQGEELENVYRIPRLALRNDSEIWLVANDNKLAIRPVRTIWRDEESVVVQDGISPGERLVVSELGAPVAGMVVRIEQSAKKEQPNKPE
ncbi:MAG: efflux RND transporter periplasmic adaptor subunit [Deltaproteobacteria bacterium]|jgi:RND family efflux transporter MFP subunit|nr:efflux RND transporter periplasmic adaptor subunit [Deltaproteobacteria bacterium]